MENQKEGRYCYTAYGLTIQASLALPSLQPGSIESEPDIVIREGTIERPLPEDPDSRGCYKAAADEALVYYREVGQILARGGKEIILDRADEPEERVIRHIPLGVAMGIILHQRGHLTLHASGVGIDGSVAAFIGWKRMGKSTTAAALCARGHRLITDDTVVLDRDDVTKVLPGTSQMRLNPDSVTASLGVDPDTIPRLQENYEKRVGLAENFDLAPLPLRHVYVLDWGEEIEIERLKAKNAFIQLLTHSYAQRFLKETAATKHYFRQVEALVRQVPFYRLQKPVDLDQLPVLIDRVEAHMQGKRAALSAAG